MKKYVFVLFLIITLTFLSCQNKNNLDQSETLVEDEESLSLCFHAKLLETFEISKNVFSGEIIDFEYDEDFNAQKRTGNITLKLKLNAVYKGEYIQNEIVEEIYPIGSFDYSIDRKNYLEKGQKYFFMLGIDENVEDMQEAQKLSYYSYYRCIKLFDFGRMELVTGDKSVEGFECYQEVIDILLKIDTQIRCSYDYLGLWDKGLYYYDSNSNNCLGEAFEISDDVYIGKIQDSKIIGVLDDYIKVYSIKVKIISVFKGAFIPGEVVEDISLVRYKYHSEHEKSSIVFLCTGKIIDELCEDPAFVKSAS